MYVSDIFKTFFVLLFAVALAGSVAWAITLATPTSPPAPQVVSAQLPDGTTVQCLRDPHSGSLQCAFPERS